MDSNGLEPTKQMGPNYDDVNLHFQVFNLKNKSF